MITFCMLGFLKLWKTLFSLKTLFGLAEDQFFSSGNNVKWNYLKKVRGQFVKPVIK